MKKLLVVFLSIFMISGCDQKFFYHESNPVKVKIILIGQSSGCYSGNYTIMERLDNHERGWECGIFGNPNDTFYISPQGIF